MSCWTGLCAKTLSCRAVCWKEFDLEISTRLTGAGRQPLLAAPALAGRVRGPGDVDGPAVEPRAVGQQVHRRQPDRLLALGVAAAQHFAAPPGAAAALRQPVLQRHLRPPLPPVPRGIRRYTYVSLTAKYRKKTTARIFSVHIETLFSLLFYFTFVFTFQNSI